jgi:predicted benzoate:H+ symporter BenE
MHYLTLISQAFDPTLSSNAVWEEALRISGVAMGGIFVVMGLFAAMIVALTKLFPDEEESR